MAANASIEERPLLPLSLDGGGVRGLSSIMILKCIMNAVNEGRSHGSELEPWQYWIFTPKRSRLNFVGQAKDFAQVDGNFDAAALEAAIKEVTTRVASQDVLLKDPDGACKVFVVAVRDNNSEAALLRSYRSLRTRNSLYDECKVWEACRATSAAITFFVLIKIGKYGQTFADGAIRYNNPIRLVHHEAEALWPGRACFILSVGTGSAPGRPFKGSLKAIVDGLKAIATETEHTANDFHHAHRNKVQDDLLFRFSVYHGLADIELDEYKKVSAIADGTEVYLDQGETLKKLEVCIARLRATIADDWPYPEQALSRTIQNNQMLESFPAQYTGTPKFSRTMKLEYLQPTRSFYLCYLTESGIKRRDTASAQHDLGIVGGTAYAYTDYGTTDFEHDSSQDLEALHDAAQRGTRS